MRRTSTGRKSAFCLIEMAIFTPTPEGENMFHHWPQMNGAARPENLADHTRNEPLRPSRQRDLEQISKLNCIIGSFSMSWQCFAKTRKRARAYRLDPTKSCQEPEVAVCYLLRSPAFTRCYSLLLNHSTPMRRMPTHRCRLHVLRYLRIGILALIMNTITASSERLVRFLLQRAPRQTHAFILHLIPWPWPHLSPTRLITTDKYCIVMIFVFPIQSRLDG